MTAARMSALSVVVFGGATTIGQLAHAEHVSAPTMTRLLAGMELDGLVKREGDRKDRRVVWIHATPKGARILREGRRRRVVALTKELAALNRAELDVLARASTLIERIASRPLDR
ncbi:MAG: MarR family winged helix-turn-helix transcriptional regulator [Gemmatimonadaceae bacterium]